MTVAAKASLRSGALSAVIGDPKEAPIEDIAALARELVGTGDVCWGLIFGQIGGGAGGGDFDDVVVLSPKKIVVLHRSEEDTVYASVGDSGNNIGFSISSARRQFASMGADGGG